jgi:hypothetical protein
MSDERRIGVYCYRVADAIEQRQVVVGVRVEPRINGVWYSQVALAPPREVGDLAFLKSRHALGFSRIAIIGDTHCAAQPMLKP